MKSAHPYLNFAGNTEEAFNAYSSIFGSEIIALTRFREMGSGRVDRAVSRAGEGRSVYWCVSTPAGPNRDDRESP